jgi:hypothetical protein
MQVFRGLTEMFESVKQYLFFFIFARVVAAISPWLSSFIYVPHGKFLDES